MTYTKGHTVSADVRLFNPLPGDYVPQEYTLGMRDADPESGAYVDEYHLPEFRDFIRDDE